MTARGRPDRPPRTVLRVVEGGGATSPPVHRPIEVVRDERHPYADLIELMDTNRLAASTDGADTA